jgi:hypothetical protein
VYFNLYVFDSRREGRKILNLMVAGIIRNQSALNFLVNTILICYCRSQIFELCHIFRDSISYLYVILLFCSTLNIRNGMSILLPYRISRRTTYPMRRLHLNTRIWLVLWGQHSMIKNRIGVYLNFMTVDLLTQSFIEGERTYLHIETSIISKINRSWTLGTRITYQLPLRLLNHKIRRA